MTTIEQLCRDFEELERRSLLLKNPLEAIQQSNQRIAAHHSAITQMKEAEALHQHQLQQQAQAVEPEPEPKRMTAQEFYDMHKGDLAQLNADLKVRYEREVEAVNNT